MLYGHRPQSHDLIQAHLVPEQLSARHCLASHLDLHTSPLNEGGSLMNPNRIGGGRTGAGQDTSNNKDSREHSTGSDGVHATSGKMQASFLLHIKKQCTQLSVHKAKGTRSTAKKKCHDARPRSGGPLIHRKLRSQKQNFSCFRHFPPSDFSPWKPKTCLPPSPQSPHYPLPPSLGPNEDEGERV